MKKIIFYLTILASVLCLGACNVNDYPVFDDEDAFVAFPSERFDVDEDTGKVRIPVRFTSLDGKSSTVTFELKDSTARSGVDYALSGGASVLTFDESNPVQYIELDILDHLGTFTGDKLFGITITNATNVNIGSVKTTYITIADIDHPLSALLGSYTVTANSYFNGASTWNVAIEKDAKDLSKVWISNFVVNGTGAGVLVYGIVNDEKNKIEIPVNQDLTVSSSSVLRGFDNKDINKADVMPDGSKLVMDLTNDSPVTFKMNLPYGAEAASGGWYNIILGDATFVRQ